MAKGKKVTVYFCQSCGYESSKWMGQCPGCREWNTFVEEAVEKKPKKETKGNDTACIPEAVEEYVIVQKKKNYFWLGMLLGLLLGFALGLMALFAYLVQNMKISLEDLIF